MSAATTEGGSRAGVVPTPPSAGQRQGELRVPREGQEGNSGVGTNRLTIVYMGNNTIINQ